MSPFWSSVILSLVRYAMTTVGTWVIAKGILTEDQVNQIVINLALFIGVAIWSYKDKAREWFKKVFGLTMPPGTTEAQLEKAVKDPAIRGAVTVPVDPTVAPSAPPSVQNKVQSL